MCDCSTYDSGKCETIPLPDDIDACRNSRSISVDLCIVSVIKMLLDNKVQTLGCCCGHNKLNPEIVVVGCYTDEECDGILAMIKEIDDRHWIIRRWHWVLTKYMDK